MRMPPSDFWRLSLPEWRASVRGFRARHGMRTAPPLARAELEALMEHYPDG